MDKEQSKILKGVAIMLMVAHHLFNNPANVALCEPWLIYKGVPVVHILSDAFGSLRMYLVLGGYGLYILWSRGETRFWSRIRRLFVHYWFVLAIFLGIAIYMEPATYPGSCAEFIGNIVGYRTTYNEEMWFLLPYAIVMAMAPWLFKISKNKPWWLVLAVSGLCYIIADQLRIYVGNEYIYNNYLNYAVYKVMIFLSNFMLGAMAARHDWFARFKTWCQTIPYHKILCLFAFLILFVAERYTHSIYARAFMMLLVLNTLSIGGFAGRLLTALGRQSTNIWMIHTWLCYYLFQDFFYSLKYPLVIFLAVLGASYTLGVIIDFIRKNIRQRIPGLKLELPIQK